MQDKLDSGKAGCINIVSAVNRSAQSVALIKLLISSETKSVCVLYCDFSASLSVSPCCGALMSLVA